MITSFKNGVRDGLKFDGRLSRGAYWSFAPAWACLCIGVLMILCFTFPARSIGVLNLMAAGAISIPLWSATARRFHDAGFSTFTALYPLLPMTVALCTLYVFLAAAPTALDPSYNALSDPLVLVFSLSAIVSLPAFVLRWFVSQGFGERIGEMLVSSEPGPNAYGPNPHEVPND